MNNRVFTGLPDDDRRIARDLQAMGAFESSTEDKESSFSKAIEAVAQFITWMRWKGEVNVYGCRVAADSARKLEGMACS
ncbi:hypothetical protein [Motiliproteus sp. MSK22-1]|uniref:hypothetical protein n=1 Tax=Motiliproteus sp. MSK22-1 TaxID=1897630 RepID=UPI000976C68F|nr:hypothetical protein [Motiliproteus sp. MSK22-1]OMH25800.1 hypothetical protein BGP75_25085 [Motiliproteus sp. MSK22-1]